MTTLQLKAGSVAWTVGFEDWAMPAADLFQALIVGRAVDETTGRPVAGSARLACDRLALTPIVDGDGMFGWGGHPRAVWGGAAALPLPCVCTMELPGFLPRHLEATLPAQAAYPDVIQLAALGDVLVHRTPVTIKGRVTAANGAPRPGATIAVSGLWHRTGDFVDETSPSTIGALAAVTPGTARQRDGAGVRARVRRLQLRPERSSLLDDVLPGTRQLRVTAGVPFVPGSANDVVAIQGLGDVTEVMHVDAVASPVTPDEVLVTLRHPLAEAHPRGAEMRNARLTAAGAWSPVQFGIHAGDRSVCVANAGVLNAVGEMLEIDAGGFLPEVQSLAHVVATADARGFFALPPVHRAAVLRLAAQHPAEALPAENILLLDPTVAAARGDIVFPT